MEAYEHELDQALEWGVEPRFLRASWNMVLRVPKVAQGPSGVSYVHHTLCLAHPISLHAPAQQDARGLS
jgi:hypothetical protein